MSSNLLLAEDRSACAMTSALLQEDVKPTICVHGLTVETCTSPECANFEISKILDSLQNFERNVEGTSPLATDKPVFDFEGPQPTSPSQWEDFTFDLALPEHPPSLSVLQQPQCGGGTMLLHDGGNMANQRASESPGLHEAVFRCRMQRDRHPSSSMSSEGGYSSDHTAPSPGPFKQVSLLLVLFFIYLKRSKKKGKKVLDPGVIFGNSSSQNGLTMVLTKITS